MVGAAPGQASRPGLRLIDGDASLGEGRCGTARTYLSLVLGTDCYSRLSVFAWR